MFDLPSLIKATGYIGLFTIVFAESGLLIGFFLPGDSLLFTAGFLASQQFLNIWLLLSLIFIAAVSGDTVGYFIGKKFGPKILKQKKYAEKTEEFFKKYGKKAIIFARFIPIVRTFTPTMAGVGKMNYQIFLIYNIIGGFLWSVSMTGMGFLLGKSISNAEKYILPIVILIIFLSILPGIIEYLKMRKKKIIQEAETVNIPAKQHLSEGLPELSEKNHPEFSES